MSLWIMTQNKRQLVKCESVEIEQMCSIQYNLYAYKYDIENGKYLGSYDTEERAMEVLEDITHSISKDTVVYNMPKE